MILKRLMAAILAACLAVPAFAGIDTYSTTAASNTTVDGTSATNVAEGNPPGTINDAIRAMMADLATYYSGNGQKFTGNVGIGAAPDRKFVVNGDIGLWNGSASNTGWTLSGGITSAWFNNSTATTTNPIYQWLSSGGVTRLMITEGGTVRPGADNTQALGDASNRWATVYAGTGSINTSDEREKDWRGALTPAELRAAKTIVGEIGGYRWLSDIGSKGDAAQIFFGVRAQKVAAALEAEGLSPSHYAMVVHDTWMEGGATRDRWGIRPDAVTFFLIAAQEQRLEALETLR